MIGDVVIIQMRSRPTRRYFTPSTPAPCSQHPPQEMAALISTKKQYQTLIKQELAKLT